jgi:hypothetical protein
MIFHGEGETLTFQCSNVEVCGYREDIPVADLQKFEVENGAG